MGKVDIRKSIGTDDSQAERREKELKKLEEQKSAVKDSKKSYAAQKNPYVVDIPAAWVYAARQKAGKEQVRISLPDPNAPKGQGFRSPNVGAIYVDKGRLSPKSDKSFLVNFGDENSSTYYTYQEARGDDTHPATDYKRVSSKEAVNIIRERTGKTKVFQIEQAKEQVQKAVQKPTVKQTQENTERTKVDAPVSEPQIDVDLSAIFDDEIPM